MSVAGKVAITLDPYVEWSAEKTYDKLVAVRYQNKLYISRKSSTNVLPTDNEYWMLAVSGAEVETMTNNVMGVAKPDNDTITVKDGVIKAEINKELLDKLGESDKGTLTFDGSEIKAISDYVFDTFEEAEAAVKAGLVEEGATVYVKEDSDSIPEMNGATADADGRGGTVPAPKAGQENHVLKGNGAWEPLEYDSELSAESENAPKTKVVEARAREIETNLSQLSNPNLLINPDFKINQRGGKISLAGTTLYDDVDCTVNPHAQLETVMKVTKLSNGNYMFINSGGVNAYIKASDVVEGYCDEDYTVDRWSSCGINGYVKVTDNGVYLYKAQDFIQRFELGTFKIGETYTASAKVDGEVHSYTFTVEENVQKVSQTFGYGWLFNTIQNWGNSDFISINVNVNNEHVFHVEWVKLELGSVATPFVPPDPASELLKCQRYGEPIGCNAQTGYVNKQLGVVDKHGVYCIQNLFSVEKRVIPTITKPSDLTGIIEVTNVANVTPNDMGIYANRQNVRIIGTLNEYTNLSVTLNGCLWADAEIR